MTPNPKTFFIELLGLPVTTARHRPHPDGNRGSGRTSLAGQRHWLGFKGWDVVMEHDPSDYLHPLELTLSPTSGQVNAFDTEHNPNHLLSFICFAWQGGGFRAWGP